MKINNRKVAWTYRHTCLLLVFVSSNDAEKWSLVDWDDLFGNFCCNFGNSREGFLFIYYDVRQVITLTHCLSCLVYMPNTQECLSQVTTDNH